MTTKFTIKIEFSHKEKYELGQKLKAKLDKHGRSGQSRQKEEKTLEERMKNHKVGSLGAIIELTKQLIHDLVKSKEKRQEIKEITKKDILAIILTIVVVILIGIILWFIPFTNGWMRELLFENPLFNWIGGLFF